MTEPAKTTAVDDARCNVAETYPIEGFWQTQIVCNGGGEVFATTAGRTESESRQRAESIVSLQAQLRQANVNLEKYIADYKQTQIDYQDLEAQLRQEREADAARWVIWGDDNEALEAQVAQLQTTISQTVVLKNQLLLELRKVYTDPIVWPELVKKFERAALATCPAPEASR